MSVLLQGMNMPTRCEDCPVCHYMERGTITACGCKATMMIRPIDCNSKPYWCPLVEVPQHGRLIDADDIEKRIKMWLDHPDEYIRKRNQDMLHYIQQEDTVIEAEDGAE